MIFWLLAILMTVLALAAVLFPLCRRADKLTDTEGRLARDLAQARLAEVDGDLLNATITPEQARYIRRELERELQGAAEREASGGDEVPPPAKRRWGSALAMAVLLPVSVAGLYLWLGTPELADTSRSLPSRFSPGEVEQMIGRIEAYLQQHPADADGWLVLAHYYLAAGRQQEAAVALEHLSRLTGVQKAEESASGEAPESRAGAAAAGDRESSGGDAAGGIRAKVSLAPAFVPVVAPDDTVFIYAQEVDGQPMPVAAIRRAARDLPAQIVLNDAVSLNPGRKLSGLERVDLIARLSKTGDATPQSGDLIGRLTNVPVGQAKPLELVIDQTVP